MTMKTFSCFSAVMMVTMLRMIRAGEETRFAEQLAEVDALGFVRHLERHLLVNPGIFGEIDGAKASAARSWRRILHLPMILVAKEHSTSPVWRTVRRVPLALLTANVMTLIACPARLCRAMASANLVDVRVTVNDGK